MKGKEITTTKVRFENTKMFYVGSTIFGHMGAIRNNN